MCAYWYISANRIREDCTIANFVYVLYVYVSPLLSAPCVLRMHLSACVCIHACVGVFARERERESCGSILLVVPTLELELQSRSYSHPLWDLHLCVGHTEHSTTVARTHRGKRSHHGYAFGRGQAGSDATRTGHLRQNHHASERQLERVALYFRGC